MHVNTEFDKVVAATELQWLNETIRAPKMYYYPILFLSAGLKRQYLIYNVSKLVQHKERAPK